MKKLSALLALTLFALLFLTVACGPKPTATLTPEPTSPPTQPPLTPNLNLPASIDRSIRLDPAASSDPDTLLLCSSIYDGLTRLDENDQPLPSLALSWSVSDDQLDYVLSLRQDVTFHDGSPFNADTVLANFNRWFDPANPLHIPNAFSSWQTQFLGFKGDLDPSQQPVSSFDGIEKVDNFTVLIHLNRPVPDLMSKLALPSFLLLDPARLASAGSSYGSSLDTTNGTGPFLLSAWSDSGLELSPNPAYWGDIPDAPVLIAWK